MILIKRIDGKILKNPVYFGGNPSRHSAWTLRVDQDLEKVVMSVQIKGCMHTNTIDTVRKRISKIFKDNLIDAKISMKDYWGEQTSFPPEYKGLKNVVCVVVDLKAPLPMGCSHTFEAEVWIEEGLAMHKVLP